VSYRVRILLKGLKKRGVFKRRYPSFVSLLLIPALLCFCVKVSPVKGPEALRLIQNVPFYPQEAYQCGPASLAGVLNYWGLPVSPEVIAAEIYSPSAKGALNVDLAYYAQEKGFKATSYAGSLEDIRRNIDSAFPLIVLVDYGFWVYQQNHFMVILGYNEKGIVANSGRNQHQFIPLRGFLRTWERTKFWTLLITPK
jgi:ABC-type bacteriocin/lantibiotic exporter with double-glycine peptidase domain